MATVKTLGKTWWHHSINKRTIRLFYFVFADKSQLTLQRQPIEKAMLSPVSLNPAPEKENPTKDSP
jgi:hypothetical protein